VKNLPIALLSALAILANGGSLYAQSSYTWGPNGSGAPTGGSGTWNLSDPFWTGDDGASYQAWESDSRADAIFGGTGGTVNLSEPIQAGRVFFNSDGYVLEGSSLRLTGDNMSPAFTVANAGDTATIRSNVTIAPGIGAVLIRGAGTLNIEGSLGFEDYGYLYVQGATARLMLATGSIGTTFSYLNFGGNSGGEVGGGTFAVDNTGATSDKAVEFSWGVTTSGGDSTVRSDRTALYNVTVNLGSASSPSYDRATGSTLNLVVNGGTATQNRILIAKGTNGYLNQGTFFNGSNFAWKNSSTGYVRAINYGADSNTATSAGGATLAGNSQHYQITGAITAQTNKDITTLKIAGAHNFTVANSNTVTVNGILKAGGNASTIAGGSIRAASGQDLVVRTDLATDTLTINSNITDNDDSSFVKSGAGSLVLGGNNSYAGSTYLNGGLTTISTLANKDTAQALGRGNLAFAGGSLRYTGGNATSNKEIDIGIGGGSFEITDANTTVDLTSRVSSSGTGLLSDYFVKDGPGTLIFSGSDDNGLDLIVKSGKVVLAKDSAMYLHATGNLIIKNTATVQLAGTGGDQINNQSTVIIKEGGTLDFNGMNETLTTLGGTGLITNSAADTISTMSFIASYETPISHFAGTIEDGAGTMAVSYNGGTHILSGENTYTGGTSITDSTLQIGNGGTTGSIVGNVYLNNVSSLVFNRSDTYEYSGSIEGWQGSVNQIGTGTLILSGNSENYYGATNVLNGTLLMNGYIRSAVIVEAGATLGGTGTIDNTTLVKSGGRIGSDDSVGTLTFGYDLTLEGDITMSFQLGTESDMLLITGGLLYGPESGKITLDITAIAGFAAGTYTLIDFEGTSFADISADDFVFGTTTAGYEYDLEISGNKLNLIATAVPEPATIGILILGLCTILFAKRRGISLR